MLQLVNPANSMHFLFRLRFHFARIKGEHLLLGNGLFQAGGGWS